MPGLSKKIERSGDGVSEKGEGWLHPLPLLLIFRNLSQFLSPSRAFGKGKETAAMQATLSHALSMIIMVSSYYVS